MGRPFVRLWLDDFNQGTMGLGPAEGWAYTKLLVWMYQAGGPIKRLDKPMAAMCGMTIQQFKKAADTLVALGKIKVVDGDKLINDRVMTELSCVNAISDSAKEKSKKGNAKRWGKTNEINGHVVAVGTIQGEASDPPSIPQRSLTDPDKRREDKTPIAPITIEELIDAVGGRLEAAGNVHGFDISPVIQAINRGWPKATVLQHARERGEWLRTKARQPWKMLAGDFAGEPPKAIQDQSQKQMWEYEAAELKTDKLWRYAVDLAWKHNQWPKKWGPRPGQPDCLIPQAVLEQFDEWDMREIADLRIVDDKHWMYGFKSLV